MNLNSMICKGLLIVAAMSLILLPETLLEEIELVANMFRTGDVMENEDST